MAGLREAALETLRSPSKGAAAIVALLLVVDLPGTISRLVHAAPGEIGFVAVVAPVTYLLGLFFTVRLWRRPTRTIVVFFLFVWTLPLIATVMGGGLDSGTILLVAIDLSVAALAVMAWTEPRVVDAARRPRR